MPKERPINIKDFLVSDTHLNKQGNEKVAVKIHRAFVPFVPPLPTNIKISKPEE
jgi:hypothetical protein